MTEIISEMERVNRRNQKTKLRKINHQKKSDTPKEEGIHYQQINPRKSDSGRHSTTETRTTTTIETKPHRNGKHLIRLKERLKYKKKPAIERSMEEYISPEGKRSK